MLELEINLIKQSRIKKRLELIELECVYCCGKNKLKKKDNIKYFNYLINSDIMYICIDCY